MGSAGDTWNDLRARLRPPAGGKPRLLVTDGLTDVSGFLAGLKMAHQEMTIEECAPQAGDIVFVASRHISALASAKTLLGLLAKSTRVVVCGAMPANPEWMSVEGLFPGLVVSVLASTPTDDPNGWEATVRKLISHDTFGLRQYFAADAALEHVAIQRGNARSRIRSAILPMLEGSGIASRVAAGLVDAAEELVMRALATAGAASLDDVALPLGAEIRVAAAVDAHTVGVAVSELLTRPDERALARLLATSYSTRPVDQCEDLAFLSAARASVHLVVNNLPRSATEILCLVPRSTQRARSFATATRSVSVFSSAA